jgi:hypothetical protein
MESPTNFLRQSEARCYTIALPRMLFDSSHFVFPLVMIVWAYYLTGVSYLKLEY